MSESSQTRIADLERQVVQLQEQSSAARRELEALTYAISHDLRAPLRSLTGFSQALSEQSQGRLDAQASHYLARIQQAGNKVSELIDALLNLSRISRADIHLRSVDFTQLCIDAADAVQAKYPDRKVNVVIQPQMDIMCDSRLLRIAMESLLDNAYKFTAQQTNAQITISCKRNDLGVCYSVADNGVGFDMAYVEKLFRPFQRLHAEAHFAGVGTGLATTQKIIARHGGRIWAQAMPNQGASFTFNVATA